MVHINTHTPMKVNEAVSPLRVLSLSCIRFFPGCFSTTKEKWHHQNRAMGISFNYPNQKKKGKRAKKGKLTKMSPVFKTQLLSTGSARCVLLLLRDGECAHPLETVQSNMSFVSLNNSIRNQQKTTTTGKEPIIGVDWIVAECVCVRVLLLRTWKGRSFIMKCNARKCNARDGSPTQKSRALFRLSLCLPRVCVIHCFKLTQHSAARTVRRSWLDGIENGGWRL